MIFEEQIVERFFLTMKECVSAAALLAVFGVSIGTLLYKVDLLRRATETWVAAAAVGPDRADVSAVPGDLRPLGASPSS